MAAFKGIVLGAANVVVVALGLSAGDPEASGLIIFIGGLPGVLMGGLLGILAGVLATRDRRLRVALLTLPAFGLVVVLASASGMSAAVPAACVPTFIAALVLERWTRQVPPPPPVPVATARSTRT